MGRKAIEKGGRPNQNKSGIAVSQYKEPLKSIKAIDCDEDQQEMLAKPFKCVTCGKRYSRQKDNFSYSQSPLYNGNNHFLPTCCSCINNLVEQYTKILGNQNEAIKRVCLHFDIYVNDSMLNSSKKIDTDRSRIKNYIRQCNLSQNAGKTYDTYLTEIKSETIDTIEDFEKHKSESEKNDVGSISERTVKRWGLGYSEEEYQMLNDHYKMLKDKAGDDDIKDSLIKDLCEQHILKYRARQEKDIDKYEKISKLYQATLNSADLKPKNSSKDVVSNNPDECWGKFINVIENYSPAEFFKDKKIFEDFNAQDEYYRRFINRPTDNLISGKTDMDDEFIIKESDEDDK